MVLCRLRWGGVAAGVFFFFFLIIGRPPRSPLFPYTTLFESPSASTPGSRPPRSPTRSTGATSPPRSEEHTSELQSQSNLVCRLLLEKKQTPGLTQHHGGHNSVAQDDHQHRAQGLGDKGRHQA